MSRILYFVLIGVSLLQSCSGLLERLGDRAMPYTVIKKRGNQYLVKFQFRPKQKRVGSVHLVGTFNNWSCPGNDKGGKHYPMKYNQANRYWERVVQISGGHYHYMYVINLRSTVIDEKNIYSLPNGGQVSRLILR